MVAATEGQQVFPDVDRVQYRKAPIYEVICQIRFPVDLQLERDPPAEFQQRIRAAFPLLNKKTQSVLGGLSPEFAKAFEAVGSPVGSTTIWEFRTEDGKTRLDLMQDRLTQISQHYEGWEEFSRVFRGALDALVELYEPMFLERIGLRYSNLIRRSVLGLDNVSWCELLKQHVLGELGVSGFCERAVEANRNLVLTLPERNAKVRMQHGFAQREGSDEQCYLIDCDFFVERTDVSNGFDAIAYLHQYAARCFRWCISDRLHRAMDPQSISG